ncbi:carbonic anhydrase [Cellulomonas soli]|uniref:Carbonic anhydrase n=1 Tax=Cellulomonas soli TaxID=931535 RepID=A0A512PHT7_9CELL|nr:carbonic anhydrase family protein [Cellulomonas soli]NYI59274.1 carbonic anhydrase [Cellulomonas soli]GEP70778.1 carbonic anhydrase [Cellulomonas soli]
MRYPVLVSAIAVPTLLGLLAACSSGAEATDSTSTSAASTGSSASASATADAAEFTYEGETGPEAWADLSPDYATCADASSQSPVDLTGASDVAVADPDLSYVSGLAELTNTGHSVQISPHSGSTLTIDGKVSALAQIHLHEPSEHTVDGVKYDAELHFVHKDGAGAITVMAVLLTVGDENAALQSYLTSLPTEVDGTTMIDDFDPAALLPDSLASFRYTGSLTTPPCTEGVSWVVLEEPVEVSAAQLAAFRAVIPENDRPVQPLGERELLLDGADD